MKVRDVTKLIQDDGWYPVRTRGSHRHFKHPRKLGLVSVAGHPSVDVPRGTFNNSSSKPVSKSSFYASYRCR